MKLQRQNTQTDMHTSRTQISIYRNFTQKEQIDILSKQLETNIKKNTYKKKTNTMRQQINIRNTTND